MLLPVVVRSFVTFCQLFIIDRIVCSLVKWVVFRLSYLQLSDKSILVEPDAPSTHYRYDIVDLLFVPNFGICVFGLSEISVQFDLSRQCLQ